MKSILLKLEVVGLKKKKMETELIHGGYNAKEMLGSVSIPIFQTSTFEMASFDEGRAIFNQEKEGYTYSRLSNPTLHILEERMAQLEEAEAGLAFSSGMGAISAVLLHLLKANDHLICSRSLYGSTYSLLQMLEEKLNLTITYTDFTSQEELTQMITSKTKAIYVETPVNPTMELYDLSLISQLAKRYHIPVVVDNTFATPYLQKPLQLGCSIVVHSATKYLNGHGDVVAGIAVGSKEVIEQIRKSTQRDIGAVLGAFEAWLFLRGLKTFTLRMEKHCDNAERLADYLSHHPKIKQVYYPGYDSQSDKVMQKQMNRPGGILSFEIDGTIKDVEQFFNQLSLIKLAVSLGDAESLIQHPKSMTHKQIDEQTQNEMGITDTLIRLSVGLEAYDDIEADIEQALNSLS